MAKKEDRSQEGLKIGQRVKALREKQNLTLQDVAAKTGLAKSLLSEVESGEVVPHVSTLLKLAKVLNVGMASFFEDGEAVERVSVTRKGERARVKRRPHHHEGEVDYVYESLETRKPGKHMEPFLVEFMPMETSDMVFTSHEGEEFHYLLEGKLEFRTDDRVEVLEPGDAIYFESDQNHSFRSLIKKPSRAIVVVWAKS
ncbi:MAG TPA: XRE family transcriptional regulator [Syntrophales bacterium]|nr:helix-turn-helix transcriptional regulator [Syntrophobacterales bacterium]HRR42481.1 XRE family transcriptional regulator [Syntrophales bacterium]HRT71628.1 XRE family transcriptional regulator [Syntrophales bacterium]